MAKFNEYPVKTTPKDADKFMLYSAEDAANKLIDYDKLADAVLNKLTSKIFGLDAGTMTLPAALNQLNSNSFRVGLPSNTTSFYACQPGAYLLSNADYNQTLPDKPFGVAGKAIWIYNRGSGDERIGLFISAMGGKTMVGYCYGGSSLTWKEL